MGLRVTTFKRSLKLLQHAKASKAQDKSMEFVHLKKNTEGTNRK
jgi:hypothetical protein